ncbi:MAG: DUF3465 domain-containing protein [Cyanobacteria bacterium J06642_3]
MLEAAFKNRQSDFQIQSQGMVTKLLTDDLEGSQHQRFILTLDSGQTLLIAHNIDIAPRVKDLKEGDRLSFYGEYEWNDLGGIIHWTHHDPHCNHPDGWIEHQGQRYE